MLPSTISGLMLREAFRAEERVGVEPSFTHENPASFAIDTAYIRKDEEAVGNYRFSIFPNFLTNSRTSPSRTSKTLISYPLSQKDSPDVSF